MTEPREDWVEIGKRALRTLDAIRAYVEPYHLAAITPTSGDVVPDDYQRGLIHGLDHIYQLATADPVPAPEPATGSTSDGYHTFDELYEHKAALFALACRILPDISWRSRHHGDGTMFPGMFIAGMHLPNGDITYHVNDDRWDDFTGVTELPVAPEWDGHSPTDVVDRLRAAKYVGVLE